MDVVRKKDLVPELSHQDDGIHLTAYIQDESSLPAGFSQQIEQVVQHAKSLLTDICSEKEMKSFLAPIQRLAGERELLVNQAGGGWAIFRSKKLFRLMRMPTPMRSMSVVAQSFHVKPILKWKQRQEENYVLVLNDHEARLYESLYGQLKKIDSLSLRGKPKKSFGLDDKERETLYMNQTIAKIDDWLTDRARMVQRSLILVGENTLTKRLYKSCEYPKIHKKTIVKQFTRYQDADLKRAINRHLHEASGVKKEKLIKQAKRAELNGRLDLNIYSITIKAIENKVSRLYIAEDDHIWGMLDRRTAELKVHPRQLDCYDNDLLDDLSEVVLKNRAEVVVLPKSEMPCKASIAAILKPTSRTHPITSLHRRPSTTTAA